MSVKVMSAVFDRYHSGGGEMLLALALADHASDDGSNVYPSVAMLAEKTRQGTRTVQYQLRKMEESGWLVLVNAGNGGRGQRREYQISKAWLKGADIAPFAADPDEIKGATDDIKGANIAPFMELAPGLKGATDDIKGATDDIKGCNGLHPHITINEPLEPSEEDSADAPTIQDIPKNVLRDFLKVRKAKKAPLTETAINGIRREAAKAGLTMTEAVTACVEFGWQGFNAGWYADRQAKTRNQTSPNETPYQRSQRERAEQFAPGIARRAPVAEQPADKPLTIITEASYAIAPSRY